jgi:hypothetical protein
VSGFGGPFNPWQRWYAWRPVRLSRLRACYFVYTGKWAWLRWIRRAHKCGPVVYAELTEPVTPLERRARGLPQDYGNE